MCGHIILVNISGGDGITLISQVVGTPGPSATTL